MFAFTVTYPSVFSAVWKLGGKGGKNEIGDPQTISGTVLGKPVTWTKLCLSWLQKCTESSQSNGKYACVCNIQKNCLLMNLFSTELSEMELELAFRLEDRCQITSATAWPDSTSRAWSRLMCRARGPGKPRLVCKHRKGDLPLEFPAFKTDGSILYSKCVLRSLKTFLLTEQATLWAGVRADWLSRWSPLPYDLRDIWSSFVQWLDESTIKPTSN